MKKNSKDVTFRETMHLHLRGIQDINKYCPGLFLSGLLSTIVSAAIPYVTIYLSAQIINELANLRRPDIFGGCLSMIFSIYFYIKNIGTKP